MNMGMRKKPSTAPRRVVVFARAPGASWSRVVFGTLIKSRSDYVVLADARQALYYGRESGGELGLAHFGPRGETRVTAPVSRVEVRGVGMMADCSSAACGKWTSAPFYEGAS